MSNDQILEMSRVIGQIEDELRDIKFAKEQAEAVIGSNKELSDSLRALLDSARKVANIAENNAMRVIAEITGKIEKLNIQASDINSYAQRGVSKISEQSALAQSKLEMELGNLVRQLIGSISTSANQSLEAVGDKLDAYRDLIHRVSEKFIDSTSDAISNQERQIAEIGRLVALTQESQSALDSKMEELRQLDFVRLLDDIDEIRRVETKSATDAKKWRVVELSAFGVCIVLGIAILLRLL